MIATNAYQSQRLCKAGIGVATADMYINPHYTYPFPKEHTRANIIDLGFLPAWSLSALWDYIHNLDKTYEFPTSLSASELIETLVKTIEYRLNSRL